MALRRMIVRALRRVADRLETGADLRARIHQALEGSRQDFETADAWLAGRFPKV